ncbi:MAG: type II secretion system protein M [Gammaproteobacteria bacterium]
MRQIKIWFDHLQPRERQLVMAALIVLGVFLPYQLIWSPLMERAEHLREQVETQTRQLQWMRASLAEVRQLQGSAAGSQTGSLLSQVEQTATQGKLRASIRKIQPEGEKGVRIWMDNAGFDDALLWLETLQKKHAIEVADFSAERQADAGRANLRLLLETL